MKHDNTKIDIELTKVDYAILDSYRDFCDGLSEYLGNGYEIVLHSLHDLEHSAIKVINGYHTGRKEGAPITDLALFWLENIRRKAGKDVYSSYFSSNKFGDPLRSTTIPIYGENDRIIGLMCINFYMNTPLSDVLKTLGVDAALALSAAAPPTARLENYVDDIGDMIAHTLREVTEEVRALGSITAPNRNKEIIARLDERGIFKLKNGVQECATLMGISKNTVYMHLRNLHHKG